MIAYGVMLSQFSALLDQVKRASCVGFTASHDATTTFFPFILPCLFSSICEDISVMPHVGGFGALQTNMPPRRRKRKIPGPRKVCPPFFSSFLLYGIGRRRTGFSPLLESWRGAVNSCENFQHSAISLCSILTSVMRSPGSRFFSPWFAQGN